MTDLRSEMLELRREIRDDLRELRREMAAARRDTVRELRGLRTELGSRLENVEDRAERDGLFADALYVHSFTLSFYSPISRG